MIGEDIELTIVDVRGDKVRIGIKAPSHVAVHRKEIYEAIKRENEEAAGLRSGEIDGIRPRKPRSSERPSIPTSRIDEERRESA